MTDHKPLLDATLAMACVLPMASQALPGVRPVVANPAIDDATASSVVTNAGRIL